jgi:hypothetical protein
MRTTVDLPDDIYRAIKVMAAERGTTVRELVLEGLEMVMERHGRCGLELPPQSEERAVGTAQESSEDLVGFP